MTQEEIKKQIDFNNEKIASLLDPTKFTLNQDVLNLINQNEELQKQCNHIYKNKKCIYCYKEEK